jgi:protein transport protein SEC31
MMNLVGKLSTLCVTGNDKRQLSEIEKGIAVFLKRLSRGDIDSEIASMVGTMISALENRDYVTATGIQTSLVNSDWRDHKDWLKGIKFLIQLASKKL